ncbi:response regulator [Pontibacter sp. G13]|uniref:response regulator n=1 Tax=Pontibacter sp. G13 TaxID=3074898 RepID=UPI0028897A83|nr:response regulator [Pontibacter sp. G13]WNJ21102.1 response regulator [Pontibacter sp. G13]
MLVDDNWADLELNCIALNRLNIPLNIQTFQSGMPAINYLSDLQPGDPVPDLMVLDLHMPGLNGFQVLEILRTENLKKFPVVICSTSMLNEDIVRSKQLGADDFLQKPIGFKENIKVFKHLIGQFLPV